MEGIDFSTVETSTKSVVRWGELLLEASEAKNRGVLLDRGWTDRLKLDVSQQPSPLQSLLLTSCLSQGDVQFKLQEDAKAVEKWDMAVLGDGLNVAARTNSAIARLRLGSAEE